MTHPNPAVTLSVRIPPEIRNQLEELSDATGRTKLFLAAKAIEKAFRKADSKDAKFIDHNKVVDWVDSWGSKKEKAMLK